MGHSTTVKWLANNLRSEIGTYGDTKAELIANMKSEEAYHPGKFRPGDRVMIVKQLGSGFSKIIIYGKSWTMPKREDQDFEKLLDEEQDKYFGRKTN